MAIGEERLLSYDLARRITNAESENVSGGILCSQTCTPGTDFMKDSPDENDED